MFTLKFYELNTASCEGRAQSVICCAKYEVYERNDHGFITVTTHYRELGTEPGVDHHVGTMMDYDVCFIENIAGKTIDVIRQKGQAPDDKVNKVIADDDIRLA